MKLAVAIAILGQKPRDIKSEIYVETLATSWRNRNNRDTQYIRWLELERLKLLHQAALKDAEDSQDSKKFNSPTPPSQIDLNESCVQLMKSTVKFLQIPPSSVSNYDEVLSVSTDDLVRNVRELMKESDLFVNTFVPLLEKCCAGYLHVQLSEASVRNLVGLCELLADFVSRLKTNLGQENEAGEIREMRTTESEKVAPVTTDKSPENPFVVSSEKPKSEDDEIKLLASPRTEKQLLVNCIVELSRNPQLKPPVQEVMVQKILEICQNLSAIVIAKKPEVLDSLYYLMEGTYRTGSLSVENLKLIKQCIDLTIVKFPVAARFLLVCSTTNLGNHK